jgi:hypothetical protein
MISAMVTAGLDAGYLTNPRLARVHWQAGDRALPAVQVSVAGETALWVDPAEIPTDSDIAKLGLALATLDRGDLYELMVNTAAYSGQRWGELTALTIPQIDEAARAITVDRKIVEVAGHLYLEAPKNRKHRRTIYPRRTPGGYPLADRLAARIEDARAEQEAGTNPLGLIFPRLRARTGARPTSTDASWPLPIWRPAGATSVAMARGPGTACGTCSAPRRCSLGSSAPPTCPGWPGTPTTASRSTCTSAPPPASWTAHARPPSSDPGGDEGPRTFTQVASCPASPCTFLGKQYVGSRFPPARYRPPRGGHRHRNHRQPMGYVSRTVTLRAHSGRRRRPTRN